MEVGELARVVDRLSFLYVERAIVHRADNAITIQDERGTIHVPAATIAAVMFGPGTNVSHQAMMLLADSGTTTVWVGEHGVRYYSHGRPLARRTRLLEAQVCAWSNQSSRLRVARRMYEMRFPDESVSGATMQQLRGKEGARVRRLYRDCAKDAGIKWSHRDYRPDDFDASDFANQALSAATTCLYGVVHAVIVALGCSPALGFIHTGHDRSLVYDIADLYKMEIAVPVAFRVAATESEDVSGEVRRAMRDAIYTSSLSVRCVRDLHTLFESPGENELDYTSLLELWGPKGNHQAGRNYQEDAVPW